MNPTSMVIVIGGSAMLLLILGGVLAIYFGYQLVKTGAKAPEKALIKIGTLQASGQGVGSVLMVTAVAWAYFGVSVAPKYSDLGGRVEVVAFNTTQGKVTAPTITVAHSGLDLGHLTQSTDKDGQVRSLFVKGAEAIIKSPQSEKELSLWGNQATIDLNDVSVAKVQDGKFQVNTVLKSGKASTPITFVAVENGSKWVFTPDNTG